nr:unnamed protein product [Digitaria exilis]
MRGCPEARGQGRTGDHPTPAVVHRRAWWLVILCSGIGRKIQRKAIVVARRRWRSGRDPRRESDGLELRFQKIRGSWIDGSRPLRPVIGRAGTVDGTHHDASAAWLHSAARRYGRERVHTQQRHTCAARERSKQGSVRLTPRGGV